LVSRSWSHSLLGSTFEKETEKYEDANHWKREKCSKLFSRFTQLKQLQEEYHIIMNAYLKQNVEIAAVIPNPSFNV